MNTQMYLFIVFVYNEHQTMMKYILYYHFRLDFKISNISKTRHMYLHDISHAVTVMKQSCYWHTAQGCDSIDFSSE